MSDISNNINNNNGKRSKKSTVSTEERSLPFNVSMPYRDLVKLDEITEKMGVSRSEVIRRALEVFYHYRQPKASE